MAYDHINNAHGRLKAIANDSRPRILCRDVSTTVPQCCSGTDIKCHVHIYSLTVPAESWSGSRRCRRVKSRAITIFPMLFTIMHREAANNLGGRLENNYSIRLSNCY